MTASYIPLQVPRSSSISALAVVLLCVLATLFPGAVWAQAAPATDPEAPSGSTLSPQEPEGTGGVQVEPMGTEDQVQSEPTLDQQEPEGTGWLQGEPMGTGEQAQDEPTLEQQEPEGTGGVQVEPMGTGEQPQPVTDAANYPNFRGGFLCQDLIYADGCRRTRTGIVVVLIRMNEEGQVMSVEQVSNSIVNDPELVFDCLRQTLLSQQFPLSEGYPEVFTMTFRFGDMC
ncbi:MAG: hypothetical protein JW797_14530 [Bradymonadales bacterium]|nr:hypothetical protein [Bradymonadales bacterium]